LIEWAIGNTLEVLYAAEYCIANNIKVGVVLNKFDQEFIKYIKNCYGNDFVVENTKDVFATNVVHIFIHQDKINLQYENYLYIFLDENSTQYNSETEQYLSLVKALYPSNYKTNILQKLIPNESDFVKSLNIKNKYILYYGSANHTAVKRWPYYIDLMNKLGRENVIFIGGEHEQDFSFSYIYPKCITSIFPKFITNRIYFWRFFKKIGVLKLYADYRKLKSFENVYINKFSWGELVYILKNSKAFIGNDGGLMHLAAASGANGIAIFGPSSVDKNKAFSSKMFNLHTSYDCQPCQYNKKGVSMSRYFISCPYQVKCLTSISNDDVLNQLKKLNLL